MAVSRFEAQQGDTVRLKVRIEQNDVLFDPFAMGDVQIRRRTSATTDELVETIPAASIVREAVGIYYVDWAIPIAAPVGAHVDRWFLTESSGDAQGNRDADFVVFELGSIVIATGYISVDEIRAVYMPGTSLSDARIGMLIELASEICNRYTGRYFGGRSETLLADGTGQAWIVLDKIIQAFSEIVVTAGGSSYNLSIADFVTKGRWLIHREFLPRGAYGSWDPRCVTICGCAFGDIFARGQKNVAVTGVFGDFAAVPLVIQRATGLLVKYGGQDEFGAGPMASNFSSETIEGHTRTLRDVLTNIDVRGSTGIPEIDHLLNLVRRQRGRVSVI